MITSRCVRIVAAAWCFGCAATCFALAAQTSSTLRETHAPIADARFGDANAVPTKVRRYAERLIRRYDRNKDGILQTDEWAKMQGRPESADGGRDGAITLDELTNHIAAFGRSRRVSPANSSPNWDAAAEPQSHAVVAQDNAPQRPDPDAKQGETVKPSTEASLQPAAGSQPPRATTFHVPKSRLPAGLPDWFVRRDLDGDGQVSLAEYAPGATPADLEQFARYDGNADGVITARECLAVLKPPSRKGGASAGKSSKRSSGK